MGLFGKKKVEETISDKSEESRLKEGLETEIENIQNEFRTTQEELNDIKHKILTVKEEYNNTVSNLMRVKKEINQKKMELDVVQREYKGIREKIKTYEQIKDSESVREFDKTKGSFSKIKQELEKVTEEHNKIKKQVVEEQSTLHNIRKQQIEYEKELDEARSRLYNAKEEEEFNKDGIKDLFVRNLERLKNIIGFMFENKKIIADLNFKSLKSLYEQLETADKKMAEKYRNEARELIKAA